MLIGEPFDFRTLTTAGAKGPVGDVDFPPRLSAIGGEDLGFLPRFRPVTIAAPESGAELGIDSMLFSNSASRSACNFSMFS